MRSARAAAIAAFTVLLTASAGLLGPGRPVPAHAAPALPSDRLHFGVTNGPSSLGWMTGSGVPWRYRYQYLSGGVNTQGNWTTWQDPALPPGQFAVDYMNRSTTAPANYIPVFTWYELLQSTPSTGANESDRDYANLNNAATMNSYYGSFRLLLQKAGAYGKPVVIHVEPDFWGYMQQRSGNTTPGSVGASVQSSGFSDVNGYANTVAGFGQAMLHLRDVYAPNAVMANHASPWSTNLDIAGATDANLNVAAEADKTASFLNAAGSWDAVFNDVDDHDAGWWEAQGSNNQWFTHWLDPTNAVFPNFSRYLAWVSELHAKTGRPQVVWQVPEGNQYYLTMNNTCGHYQDNVAQYFLGHPADLFQAGLIAVLFGAGNSCQSTNEDSRQDGASNNNGSPTSDLAGWCSQCNTHTSQFADDDGGYIRTFVGAYYANASGMQTTRLSYHLDAQQPDNASTWYEVDPALRITVSTGSGQAIVLGGNMDLWTAAPGYNQDLGIFVGTDCWSGHLLAWKESGGFAGTFSPNAAFVQTVLNYPAGTWTFTLCWKANQPAPAGTIFGGAGTAGTYFSPTTLSARVVPAADVATAMTKYSYNLGAQQPDAASTWYEVDPTLRVNYTAPAAGSLRVGGNMDLWTAAAGYNQDLGIFNGDCALGHRLAWKESGGFAGTFSPNAAFIETVLPVTNGQPVSLTLCWKANKPAPAGTVYGGAGTASTYFSPTRLTAEFVPGGKLSSHAQSLSYRLNTQQPDAASNWYEVDPSLRTTVSTGTGQTLWLGANMDLWTAAAGYNQDFGIFVGTDCWIGHLLAWKESGGFAGTFSPNAAYVQTVLTYPAGTWTFTLCWKANQPAPAGTLFGGAGTSDTYFSPTRLTTELTG